MARTYKPSTEKAPSARQWWRISQEAIRLLGLDKPENRAEASTLIDRLAEAGMVATEEAPF